ncbi:MAG: 6-hydroxymethylpterin diphosphokinase MptE-like protein, partial [Methylococcales bacterium]
NLLPAKLLNKAFAGKTVAVLAGGPSLDEVLPWIQSHREQLVVFAVSRISRQLKNINLEPDFIFSVDPTELSFDISKEMLEFSTKPIFIYSYHTVPLLVNQWHGRSFYLGPRLPWQSKLNPDNFDSTGPTVTNTALSMAYHLGFKRIILAGVDLCFTKEGYTHAKGSDEHQAGPRFNLTSLQVETNGGFLAPTSCDFAAAINTLAVQAKIISGNGSEIINPSKNAAKVAHIHYQPLAELNVDNAMLDVDKTVNKCIAAQNHKAADTQTIIKELKRVHFQITAIKRLAETALTINGHMYTDLGMISNYKDKRELDKIEKKLNRDHRHYSKLVKRFGIRHFIKITQPFSDADWSAAEAQKIGATYYEAYRKGAAALAALLDDAIARLTVRLEEQKHEPDFNLIFAQWRKDHSFGRARLWREQHADVVISSNTGAELAELDKHFADILHNHDTKHMARAKSHTSFSTLKKRAALLFKHQKAEALQDLLSGLHKHPEQQQAQPYMALVNGYLAELQQHEDVAMQAYQTVIDYPDAPVLLEDALLRIAAISINANDINNTNAYLALQCLAQISPTYLPFYAEINRLRGDTLAAIDCYNDYIRQFPDDNVVQMKLAALYIDNQSYEAAELMIDFILTKDANAPGATQIKTQLRELRLKQAQETEN